MNKVMLVTGGSRGIGAAISKMAAANGYSVAINYHAHTDAADDLVREIKVLGGVALAIKADISDPTQVKVLFESVKSELGVPSVLINNAGITGKICRFDEVDPEIMSKVIGINTMGALYCSQKAIKLMSTRYGGKGGSIISVSSIAARLGSPGEYVWYAASKAAVDAMTIGLAKEVGGEGIKVNAVSPGIIDTEIHASGGEPGRVDRIAPAIPMKRAGTAQEIANAVLWLCSDQASYCNGTIFDCSGGR
ncbi:sugar dehydrogenase [Kiloniella litopenaei]|uniref:Sugar dehydrogenase n=1 Tax=Kiloniella litopenaei TaxID=1549748 RepID=A0A0M2R524_9PROT|nr:SDR family oxidoreductase [Kiloniella litopenaei]KKJ76957.1 sugar dehydrogenase [Kiloniella litopenaei]